MFSGGRGKELDILPKLAAQALFHFLFTNLSNQLLHSTFKAAKQFGFRYFSFFHLTGVPRRAEENSLDQAQQELRSPGSTKHVHRLYQQVTLSLFYVPHHWSKLPVKSGILTTAEGAFHCIGGPPSLVLHPEHLSKAPSGGRAPIAFKIILGEHG